MGHCEIDQREHTPGLEHCHIPLRSERSHQLIPIVGGLPACQKRARTDARDVSRLAGDGEPAFSNGLSLLATYTYSHALDNVDRFWPRGLPTTSLKIDGWSKQAAPSTALRRWFQHDPQRWDESRRRYFHELDANVEAWKPLLETARGGPLTLIYSARDAEHNNGVALAEFLRRQQSRMDRPGQR